MNAALRASITMLQGVVVCAVLALSVLTLEQWGSATTRPDAVMATRPPAPGSLEAVLEAHPRCWTGGEGHPIPTRVIVARPDGRHVVRGERVTRLALEQLPKRMGGPEIDHGLEVRAYCP